MPPGAIVSELLMLSYRANTVGVMFFMLYFATGWTNQDTVEMAELGCSAQFNEFYPEILTLEFGTHSSRYSAEVI